MKVREIKDLAKKQGIDLEACQFDTEHVYVIYMDKGNNTPDTYNSIARSLIQALREQGIKCFIVLDPIKVYQFEKDEKKDR